MNDKVLEKAVKKAIKVFKDAGYEVTMTSANERGLSVDLYIDAKVKKNER